MNRNRTAVGLVIAASCLLSAGCVQKTEQQLIVSAQDYLQKKDPAAAAIELKAALQKNADSPAARFLLGRALLMSGDPAGALVELERARSLQFDPNQLVPVLANALVGAGQRKKAIQEFGATTLSDRSSQMALSVTIASALLAEGDYEQSARFVARALELDPKNVDVRLLKARLSTQGDKFEEANAAVDAILAEYPAHAEAWQVKSELLALSGAGLAEATQAARKALSIDPNLLAARLTLIRFLQQSNDVAGFKAEVGDLAKKLPNSPSTYFYRVQLALIEGDMKAAREGVAPLLRAAPDNARFLQLAGTVELQAGSLVAAERHFTKALQASPTLVYARRKLAQTQLKLGSPSKALAALAPVLSAARPDAESVGLAAEAYLLAGDLNKAETYYREAAKLRPEDKKAPTALALTRIAKGQANDGLAMLESIAAADSETYADLALITARLNRSEFEPALKAIAQLESKMPRNALPHVLRGRTLLKANKAPEAQASFERALTIEPANFAAITGLAGLDVAARRFTEAKSRYEALLQKDPNNYRALLALVELGNRVGDDPARIAQLLASAVRAAPAEVAPRLAQVNQLISERRFESALAAAQEAVSAVPDSPDLVDALGRAQLASGDHLQAINTFRRLVELKPDVSQAYVRMAEAHLIRREFSMARATARKAIELEPASTQPYQTLVRVLLAEKKPEEAMGIARTLQKQRPLDPFGFVMEAELQQRQRAMPQAVAAYSAALKRQRATPVAVRLHALYTEAGMPAEAERFAQGWLKDTPRDVEFMFHLALKATESKNDADAEHHYREILKLAPDTPAALNNLALLLAERGQSEAVALATQANRVAPDQPPFMDTLAAAYAANKQGARALEVQRAVVAKAPGVALYRLRLARLLIDAGDRAAAKVELEKLQGMGDKFNGQAEVSRLLKGL